MTRVEVIPCLTDNYAYLVINEQTNKAVLIDAPEAEPINQELKKHNLTLEAVLITHHHHDHVEGLEGLDKGHAKIYGNQKDASRLPHLDIAVMVGDSLKIAGFEVDILPADGHTIGHIAYYFENERALFTADSLMIWGCGRLFEGTPQQMQAAFDEFASLPSNTLIFSGHNYAEANGRFALSLGGFVERMNARFAKIEEQNRLGIPVCPVELSEELLTNPYYLVSDDAYVAELGIENLSVPERFAHIRKLRDRF